MHGLIFETGIWLLAGSTRFLIFKTHRGIAANQFWFSNKVLLEKKTLSDSGKTQNSISATPTQFSQQTTYYCWPVTKPLSLTKPTTSHCNLTITHIPMRLQEFIKRTNTTSHHLATPPWNRCKSAVAALMIAKRLHASKRGKRSKTPHNRYFSIAKQNYSQTPKLTGFIAFFLLHESSELAGQSESLRSHAIARYLYKLSQKWNLGSGITSQRPLPKLEATKNIISLIRRKNAKTKSRKRRQKCRRVNWYTREVEKKACSIALARRFTLSQNGYGTYNNSRDHPFQHKEITA